MAGQENEIRVGAHGVIFRTIGQLVRAAPSPSSSRKKQRVELESGSGVISFIELPQRDQFQILFSSGVHAIVANDALFEEERLTSGKDAVSLELQGSFERVPVVGLTEEFNQYLVLRPSSREARIRPSRIWGPCPRLASSLLPGRASQVVAVPGDDPGNAFADATCHLVCDKPDADTAIVLGSFGSSLWISSAVDPAVHDAIKGAIDTLKALFRGQTSAVLKFNIGSSEVDSCIEQVLQGYEPSVSSLANGYGMAVEVRVLRTSANELITKLKAAGARDIIQIPVSKSY